MAFKEAASDRKRKEVSSAETERDGLSKKPRVGPLRRPFEREDPSSGSEGDGSFDGLSDEDEEDRGVELKSVKPFKIAAQKTDKPQKQATANGAAKGNVFERGENSRESHARQKQLALERKASKPLADELHRLKKLWEKLRRKSHVPKEERKVLVDELFSIISGRIKEFVLKHDAVRAVQTAVKYSTAAQRKQIAKELQGTYAQLAESRYAKFLIGKLLVTGDKEVRDTIVPEFYGKVRRLINHAEASWILDDIYRGVATADQKAIILREWYGPEFVLFKPQDGVKPSADLVAILADEPSKRGTVLKYLMDMINQLIQKQLTGFTMLHDAMLQYYLNVKPDSEEGKEFLEIVKGDESGDLLRNMAFTKPGAQLSCLLLAHGNAKDRKQLIKAYKDTFRLMCGDLNGHMVILTACDVIDDTVLTAKAIFPEMLGKDPADTANIIFLSNDPYARATVLYLLDGSSKPMSLARHKDKVELLEEIYEIRKTTSKKDAAVRRKELVAALSGPLLAAIAACPQDLVSTTSSCQFVADVLLDTVGNKIEALTAIASTAAGDPNAAVSTDIYPPPPPHISLTPHGGKLFRTLIAGGRFDKKIGRVQPVDPPLNFADIFYDVMQDHVMAWATGPSSFAVVTLLESNDFTHQSDVKETLRENQNLLEAAATSKAASKGVKNGQDANATSTPKAKAAKRKDDRLPSNSGAKLLLEKLKQ